MPKISAVGLFSCDKFEETPKQKVIDLSKFKKIYFNKWLLPKFILITIGPRAQYVEALLQNLTIVLINIIRKKCTLHLNFLAVSPCYLMHLMKFSNFHPVIQIVTFFLTLHTMLDASVNCTIIVEFCIIRIFIQFIK